MAARPPASVVSRLPVRFLSSTALFLAVLGAPAAAQSGSGGIVGTIRDGSGRVLAGAMIDVEGTTLRTSSLRGGAYRLTAVPAGARQLVVRYIGYLPDTSSVTVVAGTTITADLTLKTPVQQLATITVEGRVAGQAAALNQQQAASNISSVIDAELVGRLPDQNLAEALGRVSGVALVRDQGEGRYVQIRGIDAKLNSFSIDGMRTPSPDVAGRIAPMDVVPADMVAAIKVSKTLTADMDADAIGGNVELLTRYAKAGKPLVSFNGAGGINRVNNGPIGNISGNLGSRFGSHDQLGVVLGGSWYQNQRGSQNFEMGWCVETTCNGVTSAQRLDVPSQLALRDYSQVRRTRRGFNGTLDYLFNADNQIYLKGFAAHFADDEQRYVTLANFSSGTYTVTDANHGTVAGARMDKELRLRPVSQDQRSLQFGGKHVLGGTTLDYILQTAQAKEDRPLGLTMVFRQSSMDFTYDVSDPDGPRYTVTKGADLEAGKFSYNSLRQQARHLVDDDKSGKVNLSHMLNVGGMRGMLKAGVAVRQKDRSFADTSVRFLNSFKSGVATPTLPLTVQSLIGKTATPTFLDGSYSFGPKVSADAVKEFWRSYGKSLNQDVARSTVESNQGSYNISEDVSAGYLMASLDAGNLHLIPGVRLEHTSIENSGTIVTQAGTVVTLLPQTVSKSYSNAFPSLTMRWDLNRQTVVRAAATRSLVRPDWSTMAFNVSIPDGNGVTASIGNPALLPTKATNLDLMVERYINAVGFVGVGVFHKELKDFIFSQTRAATAADNLGATVANVSQSVNGQSGHLTGVEASVQVNLTFLPGLLSGLGVNGNFTRTSSSTTFPTRPGTTSRLPGQAGNAANLGLFYDRGAVSLRAGYNFADKYLEVVGDSAIRDISVAARRQLDASGSLRLTPQTKLFIEVNNLTNQPLRRYIGKEERGWQPGDEYYRTWGMIGFRYQY